jgi:hypothetical protein
VTREHLVRHGRAAPARSDDEQQLCVRHDPS